MAVEVSEFSGQTVVTATPEACSGSIDASISQSFFSGDPYVELTTNYPYSEDQNNVYLSAEEFCEWAAKVMEELKKLDKA